MSWGQVGAALEGSGGHGGQCSDAYKLLHMPGGGMGRLRNAEHGGVRQEEG